MNAESIRVTKTVGWANWERLVINGIYPLRRFLGGSDHSAVFLTEYKAEGVPTAAIKFVPADPSQTEAQLVQWGTAATLSHPHLLCLFDVGRCLVRGRAFLFVVMEYAEQTLAEILPKRALTPAEVLELLPPTLDALAFLHRNYLVHGQLKPANFLVVNDQLKLASDAVRPVGNATAGLTRTSAYDPPELRESGNSAAGDVWGLGITLVEALTQRAPAWGEDRSETATLLTTIPPPFVDTVLRCLSRAPANRPTIMELEAQYRPEALAGTVVSAADQPVEPEVSQDVPSRDRSNKGPVLVAALAVALITSLAIWIGLPPFERGDSAPGETPPAPVVLPPAASASPHNEDALPAAGTTAPATAALPAPASLPQAASSPPPAALTPPETSAAVGKPTDTNLEPPRRPAALPAAEVRRTAAPPVAPASAIPSAVAQRSARVAPTPDHPVVPPAADASGVLHQEMPDIPRAIRGKIRGHIGVTVRVLVDSSGAVVGQFMESPGPSRYFARQAAEAAGKWEFAPADKVGPRVWLLRFEFTRDSATVRVSNAP